MAEIPNDLAPPVDSQLATDLSKQAIAGRDRDRRLRRAANWSRAMKRAFKGISLHTRQDYNELAILRDPVLRKEVEDDAS